MRRLIVLAIAGIALPAAAASPTASIALKGPAGEDLGHASLVQGPRGVLMRIEGKGLTPGWHGLHFHQKGDCSSADFKSAGAHVHGAATGAHGLLAEGGGEAGDLPNLHVGADGTGAAEVFTTQVTLAGGDDRPALLDTDGAALVVHASPDDHLSQPIGGAGARVACGVINAD